MADPREPTDELVIEDEEEDEETKATLLRVSRPLPPMPQRSAAGGGQAERSSDAGAPRRVSVPLPPPPRPKHSESKAPPIPGGSGESKAPKMPSGSGELKAPPIPGGSGESKAPPIPGGSGESKVPTAAARTSVAPKPASNAGRSVPPKPVKPSQAPARSGARDLGEEALAERMRAELLRDPDPQRAARLNYELGVLLERTEVKPARAVEHYRKAAQLRPDHLPSLQAARRTICALGRHADALPLFDAEQKLCTTPAQRARLLYEKGRLLERIGRMEEALAAYREGLALDARDLDLLRAAARCERRAEQWDALDATLASLAQAVDQDPSFKAALIAERARLADMRKQDPARSIELYAAALAIDPDVGGAAEAIKRLGLAQGHFQQLVEVYEQEAARCSDPEVRAAAGSRMAELLDTKLGDVERAIGALEFAIGEQPEARDLLERLCELYARKGSPGEQLAALERLSQLARDPAERCALSLRMAEIAEGPLADPKRAEGYYLAALDADPRQRSALQALTALYMRRGDHRGLLAVFARELDAQDDVAAKADVLARMGAVWEAGGNDREQAAQHYLRALGMQRDHDGALRALDRLLPALGRHRELALAYEQVIDGLQSKDQAAVYLFRIGALYEDRLDEPKAALAAYERVLRLFPDHLGALHAVQRAASRAGEHAQVLQALQREAKLTAPAPRAAELLVRAADLLAERLGDAAGAIALLEQLIKDHPGHARAHERLSTLYRSEQRWEGLLALLARRFEQSSSADARAELAFEIGQLHEHYLGRLPDAIAAYGRALAQRPNHVAAFTALVAALRASAKWTELAAALDARAKAASDAAERARLCYELGRLYEEPLRDPVRALEAYGRALEAKPSSRPALDARARLLSARGDFARLVKALHEEGAQSSEPRLAIAALERAAALEADAIGDAKAALASYAQLLKRAPHHASALLAVEALGVALRDRKTLAANYGAQAESADDERFKVAALRDLAAVAGSPEEASAAYRALVDLRGDDVEALAALVEQARSEQQPQLQLSLEAKLAQAVGDRGVAAAHHLAVAAQIEARDATQALAAYRTALALDPDSLIATRGLSRAALAFALPEALSDAARAEARVTRDVAVSVELLLHAAELREKSGDFTGAASEAQHALELDPSAPRAAELLARTLTRAGQEPQLSELLARAAETSQSLERRADLYTQVARLRAQHLNNLPAAVSAAERALAAKPDHVPAVLELARYLEAMGRWEQAAELHERSSTLARDADERTAAQLATAAIAVEHLNDGARAHKHLRAVLAAEPDNRRALLLQAKLYASSGKHADTLALLRKLVETAPSDAERLKCLLELARAEEHEGQVDRAEQSRWQALVLAGPDSEAARAYLERVGKHGSHARYVKALEQHLAAQRKRGEAGVRSWLAIARTQAEQLGDRAAALATLESAIRACPDDRLLCGEYAARLIEDKRPDAAVALLRAQLERGPDRPELWQLLSLAHRAAGRAAEALSSALPLLVLDAASGEQRASLQARKPRPADSAALFADELVRELDPESVLRSPAALLAQILAPVLVKLRPLELASYGVSRRDRLADDSDQPLRLAVDRVARVLAAPECEVYVHELDRSEVELGLGELPALLVPRALLARPRSQLVFALARPLLCARYELAAVAALPSHELAVLLGGAVRRQQADYRSSGASEYELDEASRAISKALPWLSRKRLDEAAATLAAQGPQDLSAWSDGVKRVAARAALLLCDDLPGALELLGGVRDLQEQLQPLAADLLRLWASETAVRYRKGLG